MDFENNGFSLFSELVVSERIVVPDRIKFPNQKILTIDEIISKIEAKKPFEFGDRDLLELSDALDYYNLLCQMGEDWMRTNYYNFIDKGEMTDCIIKHCYPTFRDD